jgi:hypothetical protein
MGEAVRGNVPEDYPRPEKADALRSDCPLQNPKSKSTKKSIDSCELSTEDISTVQGRLLSQPKDW